MTMAKTILPLIGLAALFVWLGVLMWAISAWPFTVMVAVVVALLAYDLAKTHLWSDEI
jgi:hypothetical protein